jgi:hypothetical protein
MRLRGALGLAAVAAAVGAAATLVAQGPTATLTVNVAAGRKAISPYIYGLNFAKPSFATGIGLPVLRWGGNHTTRYNYTNNGMNHGSDWFFHNNNHYDPFSFANQTADQWVDQNAGAGTDSLLTVPLTGYVANNTSQSTCGFSVAKYGAQDDNDLGSGFPDCGNGLQGGNPIAGNDPLDTSTAITKTFAGNWTTHLVGAHGNAAGGGVKFYALDNEPGLWHETHRDVHPVPLTYDESYNNGRDYAEAIKAVDPNAIVLGPVQDGWTRYFYASYQTDAQANADRNAHGGVDFVPWYLQQMKTYEDAHPGHRLLDYLDLHFYPQTDGVTLSTAGNATNQAKRLRSTRALWDPTYVDESWIADAGPDGGIVQLIPRMHGWVNGWYPGTRLALTEYNWGGLEHINGALAQAEVLGIFGREGLDLATLWAFPDSSDGLGYDNFETLPGAYAFRMYRNYDGAGGRFGDTSVSATSSNQAQLSIFAAQRTGDSALTLMIVNKAISSAVTGTVSISNFSPAAGAHVFRYSDANLNAIAALPDQAIVANGFTASFPANSITLVVVPLAATPPAVATQAATLVTGTGATLNGTANPNGSATTAHFQYGLTTGYGSTTVDQAMGGGTSAAAIGGGAVSGLTCDTVYHFRGVASNAGGTTNGSDATFTTGICIPVATAKPLVAGRQSLFDLANASAATWHSLAAIAGRSYCASVAPAPLSQSSATPTLTAFHPDATVVAGGVAGATSVCFVAPASETVYVRTVQADASTRSHMLAVVETTIWANWFYIGGDYSAYTILRNTTASDVHASIVWRGADGQSVGTQSVTLSGRSVTYFNARATTDGTAQAGSVEVAHNGEPDAIVGSQTTLSASTGLSFDTIFVRRNPR